MRVGVAEMAHILCISLENARVKACLDEDHGFHINKSFNMMWVL